MTMENCEEIRTDEIIALSAIYTDEWIKEDSQTLHYSITIVGGGNANQSLKLEFKLPPGYPLLEKPLIVISAPWMSRETKAELISNLDDLCQQNMGQSVLYILIEQARQWLNELVESEKSKLLANGDEEHKEQPTELESTKDTGQASNVQCNINIFHGDPIVDRKSTFQAHLAAVHCTKEIDTVLCQLKENRKISAATHNIWAYRIVTPNGGINQDCDDDGETHAGSRLLHLLQIVDAKNVIVVVSRWYGGILLGPDRFKHISNAARQLLLKQHYIHK